jgi:RNA polymerase sigma-70 factor (ECF subfamily)
MAGTTIFGFSQRRAFKKLVCNSRGRLYRMAYAWTHDPYLADDLVQQTLCKALNNQRQLRDMAAADAWLFRILANCLTDYRRARREVSHGDDLALVENRTPETQTQEQQLVDKVRIAVSRLPLAQCQVVTLVDLEGFTYASVAETLDIPVGTVMSRLCRGRVALRESLMEARSQLPTEQVATITRIRRIRDDHG